MIGLGKRRTKTLSDGPLRDEGRLYDCESGGWHTPEMERRERNGSGGGVSNNNDEPRHDRGGGL